MHNKLQRQEDFTEKSIHTKRSPNASLLGNISKLRQTPNCSRRKNKMEL
jgi:hypothetical protein